MLMLTLSFMISLNPQALSEGIMKILILTHFLYPSIFYLLYEINLTVSRL